MKSLSVMVQKVYICPRLQLVQLTHRQFKHGQNSILILHYNRQVEAVAVFGDKLSHDRSSKTGDGRSTLWEKWRKMSPFLATFDRVY